MKQLGGGAKAPAGVRDEIAIAGLERAHVEQFCALGFDREKVVSAGYLHYRSCDPPGFLLLSFLID